MSTFIDLSLLLSYLRTTSNLALSCQGFYQKINSNGFPIMTSKSCLYLGNFTFYKSLDCPNWDEWTNSQIFRAIKEDKADQLQLLLQGGADVEARNNDDYTALNFASKYGRTECLEILLEHNADTETKTLRWTALLWATYHGRTDCLRLLLENGANIEAKDPFEDTSLIKALRRKKTRCVRVLLEYGAKVSPGVMKKYPQYADFWPDLSHTEN